MLIFIGIPCFFLEISIGQYAALGPVTIYSNLSPLFKGKIPYESQFFWNRFLIQITLFLSIWTFLSPCYLNFSIPLLFELFYPLSYQTSMYFSSIFWFLFLCIVFLFKFSTIPFYWILFFSSFLYPFCSCLIFGGHFLFHTQ